MQVTRRRVTLPFAVAAMLALLAPHPLCANAYLRMLGDVQAYRMGAMLDLFDGHGARIARFAPDAQK